MMSRICTSAFRPRCKSFADRHPTRVCTASHARCCLCCADQIVASIVLTRRGIGSHHSQSGRCIGPTFSLGILRQAREIRLCFALLICFFCRRKIPLSKCSADPMPIPISNHLFHNVCMLVRSYAAPLGLFGGGFAPRYWRRPTSGEADDRP